MRDARSLVEEAEALLDPVACARNVAWWDANVEATDETEHRRAATEFEWSNLLADRELFDRLQVAVTNGDGLVGRRLELLLQPHAPAPGARVAARTDHRA